jgi:hypothetical protein
VLGSTEVREQYLPWCVFSYIADNPFAILSAFYALLERLALAAEWLAQKLWGCQGYEGERASVAKVSGG